MAAGSRTLDRYLERIGASSQVAPDLKTLFALHRAHLTTIPYENLDLHLGRENRLSEHAFFDKLVGARRGGWCYEMNGLFTWALNEIGFKVKRVAGSIARELRGDGAVLGGHLVGIVELDRPYVVDVGLSDGPSDPFPLAEGKWNEGPLEFALERHGDWWRFRNHQFGAAPSFDFTEEPRALAAFQSSCTFLQASETSPFTAWAILRRRRGERQLALHDLTLTESNGAEKSELEVTSQAQYDAILRESFGIALSADELYVLWSVVEARHRERTISGAAPFSPPARPNEM